MSCISGGISREYSILAGIPAAAVLNASIFYSSTDIGDAGDINVVIDLGIKCTSTHDLRQIHTGGIRHGVYDLLHNNGDVRWNPCAYEGNEQAGRDAGMENDCPADCEYRQGS